MDQNTEYNFIKFEGRNSRFENRITVTKSDSIGFPTKFCEDNGIKNFDYIILYWDGAQKAIGINFTNNKEEKSRFSMIKSQKYGANVVARSFFRNYSINPKEYHGRYSWSKEKLPDNSLLFVIKLKKNTGF